jgi:hypothetical protein
MKLFMRSRFVYLTVLCADIFLEVMDHIGPNKLAKKSGPEERRSLSVSSQRGGSVSVKDFKLLKVLGQGRY